jgi:hypothetical protein
MFEALPHHQILYSSQLSPGLGYDVLASISRTARLHNAEWSITGVLLFDGQRFCQLLQGAEQPLRALMTRIALDTRHSHVLVLSDQPMPSPAAGGWMMGYCEADDLDSLADARGDAALQSFDAIRQRADLSA